MPVTTSTTTTPKELNHPGIKNAIGGNATAMALQSANIWIPFLADIWYGKTAKSVARQAILKRQVFRQENIPVPPKPEHLKSFRLQMGIRFGKAKASEAMQYIEEASRAYWKY